MRNLRNILLSVTALITMLVVIVSMFLASPALAQSSTECHNYTGEAGRSLVQMIVEMVLADPDMGMEVTFTEEGVCKLTFFHVGNNGGYYRPSEPTTEEPVAQTPQQPSPTPEPESTRVRTSGETANNDDDNDNIGANMNCSFSAPGALGAMEKEVIEMAPEHEWFHRVFNPREFHAPNWGGADSWFVTLALGDHDGGNWTSHKNPGQIIYRANDNDVQWCLGVLTSSQWDGMDLKEQFMSDDRELPAAINVRVTPNTRVYVKKANDRVESQLTSDGGDLTIVLPDNGDIAIWTAFETDAPTFESLIWWGPYDRSENINTLDARN